MRIFALALALAAPVTAMAAPADLVLTDARIFTEDAGRHTVEALAVANGKIVYVGDSTGAANLIGPGTKVEHGGGRLVLPGLVDAHIHPMGIADLPGCSLDSAPLPLDGFPAFVKRCVETFHIPAGEWVAVQQWNFSDGNQPSAANPTFRAALDHASSDHPVVLLGNDGHHNAYNSLGLARARDASGHVIGYSAASLKTSFKAFQKVIGVDAAGEPNGTVNEEARDRIGAPDMLTANLPSLMKTPEMVTQRLNRVGITAIQDAWVAPDMLPFYDALISRGKLTVRVNLMQLYEPEDFRKTDGTIDYDRLLSGAKMMRARYAGSDLIRAPGVKIFADGVLEGNPYATPPTLPDSPSLKPYLQPIFGPDGHGKLAVKGYVDLQSSVCRTERATPDQYAGVDAATAFMKTNGFHPAQCAVSSGKLQHERSVIMDYARAAHLAGFTLHIHAIGDAAVEAAVDAIESARAADGNDKTPDTIAHLQLVSPRDVARIGKDHLFTVYTYSWATAVPEYDMSVVPFFERVSGNSFAALHDPDSYYERQFYPARSTRDAGGILAAGSDAPVGTRDPQPFVNMQIGVTRAQAPFPPANPQERLNIRDLIDAYTINGARAMGRVSEFGSLEVGKSADFIVLDQDIVKVADDGQPEKIGATKVLETWFQGRQVYRAPSAR